MTVSRETIQAALARSCVIVSRETTERLETFASLLLTWNRRINLISRVDESVMWERHIADSLQLVPLMPFGTACAIDFGSGGGFPGLILSLATNIPFMLIESDARKGAFLREAARATAAPATVVVSRIETAPVAPASVITARALAPLPVLLALAAPHLQPGGVCLFLKGASVQEELTAAQAAWNMHVERHPSRLDPQGCVLRISEVSPVRS